ncbi:MAG TPA: amino acid permease, partial [Phycisphaeraceae bacterium]
MHQDPPAHELKKSLGLVSLTIYGVGNMLGAGIYGLIGKAAGEMGNAVWMAFVTSLVAAGLTGLSYASLGSRYPRAAGAAYVTHRAFTWPMLAYVVGLAVMASGLTSMATTAQVFAGYFLELAQWADHTGVRVAIITTLIVVLAGVNFWGLRESAWLNAVCTIIEASGLLLIIAVGLR